MSRRRRFKGRDVHGILLLDKPTGLTSNDVLQKVKRIYNAAKAGHTGALDPGHRHVAESLPREATSFSQYLLEADKRYEVTAKLGERTNTSDSDGEVVSTRPVNVAVGTLIEALDQFRGPIMQVPSMPSALQAQRPPALQNMPVKGIEIEQGKPVPSPSSNSKLLGFEGRGEAGSALQQGYLYPLPGGRSGEVLGCGAHVTQLRHAGGELPT